VSTIGAAGFIVLDAATTLLTPCLAGFVIARLKRDISLLHKIQIGFSAVCLLAASRPLLERSDV
jgi:hypothetical protein